MLSASPSPRRSASAEPDDLIAALQAAARLLPTQGPIGVFVHHNVLHAFEHQRFEDAVATASAIYGAEPYLTERAFAEHLATGRIREADLRAVLDAYGPDPAQHAFPGGPRVRDLWELRLRHLFEVPRGAALDWLLEETPALRTIDPAVSELGRAKLRQSAERAAGSPALVDFEERLLRALWERLGEHAPRLDPERDPVRPRDRVLAALEVDTDELVHPLLIRVCAAFVDQGVAYWTMPERDRGLWPAFRSLYAQAAPPPDRWLSGLPRVLATLPEDAEAAVRVLLDELQVLPSQRAELIQQSLLALRGWAGLIRRLEEQPGSAPVDRVPAKLMDFLALRLVLERQAIAFVLREHVGPRTGFDALSSLRRPPSSGVDRSAIYEAFVLAQLAGLGPDTFEEPERARAFLRLTIELDALTRRHLLHLAYERRHRIEVLDALLNHARLGTAKQQAPRVQAIFCFDEREESLRRHLEETFPSIETFGYAGFFGVAMAYQGVHDARPRPLCPVVVTPKHLVVEEAIHPDAHAASKTTERLRGRVTQAARVGSRTLVRGGLVATTLGLASTLPLLGHSLWPRTAERLARALGGTSKPLHTRLRIERPATEAEPDADGYLHGFSVPEMATIVEGVLKTIGLTDAFAPLVLVVGHGSSSLNNPHESAHDCGATGGGRGGPNARAFACMANHPQVRELLAARGLAIPQDTWFVGGFHNTCDGAVIYYDEPCVPEGRRAQLQELQVAIEVARQLDAHERCRRFEAADPGSGADAALAHVEARAVDLGQPRPEYGHATNAVCIVGRRERTRRLFLDRRAFLVSYDPTTDPAGEILAPLLLSAAPVGAGINLEYYFSFVDPKVYGAGTKLPHNVVGLVGVMDGHASDLRTGLPWEMVEIHEPVRMLTVIEAEPETLVAIVEQHPPIARLVLNEWLQLVAWSPSTGHMSVFEEGRFVPYQAESERLVRAASSLDHYRGKREHLASARIDPEPRLKA